MYFTLRTWRIPKRRAVKSFGKARKYMTSTNVLVWFSKVTVKFRNNECPIRRRNHTTVCSASVSFWNPNNCAQKWNSSHTKRQMNEIRDLNENIKQYLIFLVCDIIFCLLCLSRFVTSNHRSYTVYHVRYVPQTNTISVYRDK